MAEQSGVQESYRRSSPWPVFVALGLALSELGVFLAGPFVPVGVAGVLLLEGTLVGILRESGYADTIWAPALGLGALFAVGGGAVLALTAFQIRGVVITGAGAVAVVLAVPAFLYERGYL